MAFPDGVADFRSDTVTRPTAEMRPAMATAEVGDDVYGEDPTVNALEAECAEAVGKEAALFVPSGTMANQLAISLNTRPGDEVLCTERADLRNSERGAASAISGIAFRPVTHGGPAITVADIEQVMSESGRSVPAVRLMTWENTHNACGGAVVPVAGMEEASAVGRQAGLSIHLDGARLWNAVGASGTPAPRYTAVADTVMFCFSKGLGAPIGSILCGWADAIAEARERRRRLGGGMRQVGVIAAAAKVAFRDRDRVVEDHDLARRLAEGIAARIPNAVDLESVQTNIVLVEERGMPFSAAELRERLANDGVRVGLSRPGILRFCTHRDVEQPDVDRVLATVDAMVAEQ